MCIVFSHLVRRGTYPIVHYLFGALIDLLATPNQVIEEVDEKDEELKKQDKEIKEQDDEIKELKAKVDEAAKLMQTLVGSDTKQQAPANGRR